MIGEVDLRVPDGRVPEVVRHDLERASQVAPVADQQRAALERLVEPLVRIERHRVGQLDARQRGAPALGDGGEPAVGAVDVEPDAAVAADAGQRGERVDRAGVRGARHAGGEQRRAAGAHVGVDGGGQRLGPQAPVAVCGQHAQLVGAEAEQARRAREGGVPLVGDVGDRAGGHRAEQRLARAGERRHVRRGAAAHEHAGRLLGVADPLLEPGEHDELEAARARPPPSTCRRRGSARWRGGRRARPGTFRRRG